MSRRTFSRNAAPGTIRLLVGTGLAALTLSATLVAGGQAAAISSPGPIVSTTVPPDSRIEVVPAPEWLGLSLRVDKFQGRISVLRRTGAGEYLVYPIRPAEFGIIYPDRPNYQLYIPGSEDGAVFLVSLHTGALWRLTANGPAGELVWRQVDESNDRARGYRE